MRNIIDRPWYRDRVRAALKRAPVVVLVGPRQAGKTTLARAIAPPGGRAHYFDLEKPEDLAALNEPYQALSPLKGLVVIDEVQHKPDLFKILRPLADRRPRTARFLILGSASGELLRQSSESLAGRVEYIELDPFDMTEVRAGDASRLWLRGGFPPSFLAGSDLNSMTWRAQFMRTFLERDIPQLGLNLAATGMRRVWMMFSHYHGQQVNFSDLGRSLDMADTTIRRYLEILADTFMVRLLPPWFENLGKRLVRAPKLYIRDSGIFHSLQRIESRSDLLSHPKLGASWEGFALEQVLRLNRDCESYYFATHAGAELDLLLIKGTKRLGFEFKYSDAPTRTKSMDSVIKDLNLSRLFVVYPGRRAYPITDVIRAVPLDEIAALRMAGKGAS